MLYTRLDLGDAATMGYMGLSEDKDIGLTSEKTISVPDSYYPEVLECSQNSLNLTLDFSCVSTSYSGSLTAMNFTLSSTNPDASIERISFAEYVRYLDYWPEKLYITPKHILASVKSETNTVERLILAYNRSYKPQNFIIQGIYCSEYSDCTRPMDIYPLPKTGQFLL